MGNIGQCRAIAVFDWIVLARSDDISQNLRLIVPRDLPITISHHLSARTMPGPRSLNKRGGENVGRAACNLTER